MRNKFINTTNKKLIIINFKLQLVNIYTHRRKWNIITYWIISWQTFPNWNVNFLFKEIKVHSPTKMAVSHKRFFIMKKSRKKWSMYYSPLNYISKTRKYLLDIAKIGLLISIISIHILNIKMNRISFSAPFFNFFFLNVQNDINFVYF